MSRLRVLFLIVTMIFLSGCWDQQLLRDKLMISGVSIDQNEEGKLIVGVSSIDVTGKGGGQFEINSRIFTANSGNLVRAGELMSYQGTGSIELSKTSLLLIGEQVASHDIYPLFDVHYRNVNTNMGARVAVVKGSALQALTKNAKQAKKLTGSLVRLITMEERKKGLPAENVRSLLTEMTGPEQDFILPYMEQSGGKLQIGGAALFHNRAYSGIKLTMNQMDVLSMLQGKRTQGITYDIQLPSRETGTIRMASLVVKDTHIDKNIHVSGKRITVDLHLRAQADLVEYPNLIHFTDTTYAELRRLTSEQLLEDIKKVITAIQKANCDALDLAEHIVAFYPGLWSSIKWDTVYPNIQMNPSVDVKVESNGVLK
ncbi:Ger(x)C family spore germination protein [Paenibacillus montanisoli]|uniref:Ger(X)C family spore germination protein n=1 Tax=Paenibacillus montanisoli TaxID=2081970 RepID=A0A328U410_9BACL|nr:Ger(x)C family spore germination protein [Paenibacillus montanisoli]RAP75635.1 hypothetical protein DL346_09235 [Paenibacillus montanisoli]